MYKGQQLSVKEVSLLNKRLIKVREEPSDPLIVTEKASRVVESENVRKQSIFKKRKIVRTAVYNVEIEEDTKNNNSARTFGYADLDPRLVMSQPIRRAMNFESERGKTRKSVYASVLAKASKKQRVRGFFKRNTTKRSITVLVLSLSLGVGSYYSSTYYYNSQYKDLVSSRKKVYDKNDTIAAIALVTDPPSQAPLTIEDSSNYKVEVDKPRIIDIQPIGVHTRVISYSNGSTLPPISKNIFDVVSGVAESKMLVIGRVNGPSQPAVFNRISDLKVGQTINVAYGNDSKKNYVVYEVSKKILKPLRLDDLAKDLPQSSPFRIIGCYGVYTDSSSKSCESYIVVEAK